MRNDDNAVSRDNWTAVIEWHALRAGVSDAGILAALRKIPRHRFVPPRLHHLAYEDMPLELEVGGVLPAPSVIATMLQVLSVAPHERVLHVGVGCGYVTAILSTLAHHVCGIEMIPVAAARARIALREHGCDNVTVGSAADHREIARHGPYDAIVVGPSATSFGDWVADLLAPTARLVFAGSAPAENELIRVEVNDRRITADRVCSRSSHTRRPCARLPTGDS